MLERSNSETILDIDAAFPIEIGSILHVTSLKYLYQPELFVNKNVFSGLHSGERLIQYASENLVTEILIHPQYNTLIQCMRNLLSSFTRHRHIIHAGYTFSGNGSWILQVSANDCEATVFFLSVIGFSHKSALIYDNGGRT